MRAIDATVFSLSVCPRKKTEKQLLTRNRCYLVRIHLRID